MQTDVIQTDAIQTDVIQTDPMQTNPTEPDYIMNLNNFLQRSLEGNIACELSWCLTQDGPNNQAIHTARAKFRDVILGVGQGTSKNLAKREASKLALTYLNENRLPERQVGPNPSS